MKVNESIEIRPNKMSKIPVGRCLGIFHGTKMCLRFRSVNLVLFFFLPEHLLAQKEWELRVIKREKGKKFTQIEKRTNKKEMKYHKKNCHDLLRIKAKCNFFKMQFWAAQFIKRSRKDVFVHVDWIMLILFTFE